MTSLLLIHCKRLPRTLLMNLCSFTFLLNLPPNKKKGQGSPLYCHFHKTCTLGSVDKRQARLFSYNVHIVSASFCILTAHAARPNLVYDKDNSYKQLKYCSQMLKEGHKLILHHSSSATLFVLKLSSLED